MHVEAVWGNHKNLACYEALYRRGEVASPVQFGISRRITDAPQIDVNKTYFDINRVDIINQRRLCQHHPTPTYPATLENKQ